MNALATSLAQDEARAHHLQDRMALTAAKCHKCQQAAGDIGLIVSCGSSCLSDVRLRFERHHMAFIQCARNGFTKTRGPVVLTEPVDLRAHIAKTLVSQGPAVGVCGSNLRSLLASIQNRDAVSVEEEPEPEESESLPRSNCVQTARRTCRANLEMPVLPMPMPQRRSPSA